MSLDISLYSSETNSKICHFCSSEYRDQELLYTSSITHNLTQMAEASNLYLPIWRPEDIGAVIAKSVIYRIERGLKVLKDNPEYFKKFNPPNNFGNYDLFVRFVSSYLKALKDNPNAEIHVDR